MLAIKRSAGARLHQLDLPLMITENVNQSRISKSYLTAKIANYKKSLDQNNRKIQRFDLEWIVAMGIKSRK